MNRLSFCVVVATVMMLTTTAVAQGTGDAIFPFGPGGDAGDNKLDFDHQNNLIGGPTGGLVPPIPWFWHPEVDVFSVAGLKFTIKYDPHEVDIRGIRPAPGGGSLGGFSGHLQHSTIITHPTSEPGPFPQSSLVSSVRGTVWIPHDLANNSGITVFGSQPIPFIELDIAARHSSSVNLNSDVDLVVSNLQPIFHIGTPDLRHLSSVWIPYHVQGTPTAPDPNYPELPNSARVWEHHNSVVGFPIPVSANYFPGPLPSNFSTIPDYFPKSGVHATAHVEQSDYIHVSETRTTISGAPLPQPGPSVLIPSEVYHVTLQPGSINVPLTSHSFQSVVLFASDFIIGGPVATSANHFGIGIDHIPEPSAVVLLGMAGFGAVMSGALRRRRLRMG